MKKSSQKPVLGFAMTGSFCTWAKAVSTLEELSAIYDIQPILSPISCCSDNRFGRASEWREKIEGICQRTVWTTIEQVEPIGPRNLLDALAVVPCTGNTLGKLANGITDSCVTMACKASLRNQNPLILALSTNDALGASARNMGTLLNAKNVYFVPMGQDDPQGKPTSLVARFELVVPAIAAAFGSRQLQPLFTG